MLKINVNGISLAYERRGLGEALVLIHGYPLDHTIWEETASELECNFDLILPDLRGFGKSELGQEGCSMSDYASDIAGLLDHLHVKQAYLAGHSMGGYVSLAFAKAFPNRIKGLALVSSQALADAPEKHTSRLTEADGILANGVSGVAEGMSSKLTGNPDLQRELKDLILHQPAAALACALRAMAFREDMTSFLQATKSPVLLVHGLQDALIPIDRARQVQNLVKNTILTEIEGAGHMPMMEFPKKTAQALEKFIK